MQSYTTHSKIDQRKQEFDTKISELQKLYYNYRIDACSRMQTIIHDIAKVQREIIVYTMQLKMNIRKFEPNFSFQDAQHSNRTIQSMARDIGELSKLNLKCSNLQSDAKRSLQYILDRRSNKNAQLCNQNTILSEKEKLIAEHKQKLTQTLQETEMYDLAALYYSLSQPFTTGHTLQPVMRNGNVVLGVDGYPVMAYPQNPPHKIYDSVVSAHKNKFLSIANAKGTVINIKFHPEGAYLSILSANGVDMVYVIPKKEFIEIATLAIQEDYNIKENINNVETDKLDQNGLAIRKNILNAWSESGKHHVTHYKPVQSKPDQRCKTEITPQNNQNIQSIPTRAANIPGSRRRNLVIIDPSSLNQIHADQTLTLNRNHISIRESQAPLTRINNSINGNFNNIRDNIVTLNSILSQNITNNLNQINQIQESNRNNIALIHSSQNHRNARPSTRNFLRFAYSNHQSNVSQQSSNHIEHELSQLQISGQGRSFM